MRLITRYVLREIFQVFLVTLVSLTLLMVLFGAVREAIVQGLGFAQIVQLFPYLLPNALMFAVPGTILFSVANVYGRMAGANEIVALKSAGVSPMALIWPALLMATLLSFATVWLNDMAMSWGHRGMQTVVINALEDIVYGKLASQKTCGAPGFSVTVRKVQGRDLIDPMFLFQDEAGPVTVHADSAVIRSNPGSGVLTIVLENASGDASGQHFHVPGRSEREIPLNPEAGKDPSPAHLALSEIPDRARQQREIIQTLEEQMVAGAGFQMMTGDFDSLAGNGWNEEHHQLQHQKSRLHRMSTEPPRRWANGFSCVCFALVGATMAIRRRNADALTSFFLCFLPILIVYYPLLIWGVDRSKAGAITPYAVWSANVVLIAWGLLLLRRVLRY
jgi:lipopolysaccharide export system permease protein